MSGITFRKPSTVHYMTSSFLFYLASWCLAAEVKTAIMPNLNYCYLFRFFFPQNYPCCCHYHWMSSFLPMPNWLPTTFQVRKVTFQQPRKLSSSFSEQFCDSVSFTALQRGLGSTYLKVTQVSFQFPESLV